MIVAAERLVLSNPATVVAAPLVWKVSIGKRMVGALSFDAVSQCWAFEYAPRWIKTGFSLAPLQLPLLPKVYSCALSSLALTATGDEPSVSSVLCDIFDLPALLPAASSLSIRPRAIGLELIGAAASNTTDESLSHRLSKAQTLMAVNSQAKGKAAQIPVWLNNKDKFSFSALCPGAGFTPWYLSAENEKGSGDGFRARHSYYLMAKAAGLACVPTQLLESPEVLESALLVARHDFSEQGFLYFMRFSYLRAPVSEPDNPNCVITGYRQVLNIAEQWHCSNQQLLLLFRHMVFDAITRNGSNPLEDLGFLVTEGGKCSLAPAFGFTPQWPPPTKADALERNDLLNVAAGFKCLHKQANRVIDDVVAAVEQWPTFAKISGLPHDHMQRLQRSHRLY